MSESTERDIMHQDRAKKNMLHTIALRITILQIRKIETQDLCHTALARMLSPNQEIGEIREHA
jgi:hypothetical protein